MSMTLETETRSKPAPCDPRELDVAVEFMLADQLAVERRRCLPSDLADLDGALDDFVDWCDWFSLPSSPHAFAAYLVERHGRCGVPYAEVARVARAFLFEHVWRVRVPVMSALAFCAAQSAARGALN
jgi:hypothetical protein